MIPPSFCMFSLFHILRLSLSCFLYHVNLSCSPVAPVTLSFRLQFLLLITLPLPVLDLGKGPLQWWEQTPRLHGSTQHSKAHQQHPAQRQHNGKGDPVCLDRVCDSKVGRHVLGQECQRQEQDGCFADEQRHPRKAIHSGRLRHGHQLEVLFDMSAKEGIWVST